MSIYKPIETAYFDADSSDYGWGAVRNDYPTHGLWNATERHHHIAGK
jgi:hypothetical protein